MIYCNRYTMKCTLLSLSKLNYPFYGVIKWFIEVTRVPLDHRCNPTSMSNLISLLHSVTRSSTSSLKTLHCIARWATLPNTQYSTESPYDPVDLLKWSNELRSSLSAPFEVWSRPIQLILDSRIITCLFQPLLINFAHSNSCVHANDLKSNFKQATINIDS